MHRHVNLALFPCHSKIDHPFRNLKSLPGIAAQFIGRPFLSLRGCRMQAKQSHGANEIAAPRQVGARNDSGKQPYK